VVWRRLGCDFQTERHFLASASRLRERRSGVSRRSWLTGKVIAEVAVVLARLFPAVILVLFMVGPWQGASKGTIVLAIAGFVIGESVFVRAGFSDFAPSSFDFLLTVISAACYCAALVLFLKPKQRINKNTGDRNA